MGKPTELMQLLKTGNSDAARKLISKLKKSGEPVLFAILQGALGLLGVSPAQVTAHSDKIASQSQFQLEATWQAVQGHSLLLSVWLSGRPSSAPKPAILTGLLAIYANCVAALPRWPGH